MLVQFTDPAWIKAENEADKAINAVVPSGDFNDINNINENNKKIKRITEERFKKFETTIPTMRLPFANGCF